MTDHGPVHISELLPEAMADIAQRIEKRRRLEHTLAQIDKARARIAALHAEMGPEVEAETRGVPQSQVDITR